VTRPVNARYPALAAVVGIAAAAILVPEVQQSESKRNIPYRDIVGVWTVCYGDTHNVRPGRPETDEQCEVRLERQLIAHAQPVINCVPGIRARPAVLAASASLAYNIGPARFCRSSVATYFRLGRWRDGCNAMLKWDRAGGRPVRGLQLRRERERQICLRDARS